MLERRHVLCTRCGGSKTLVRSDDQGFLVLENCFKCSSNGLETYINGRNISERSESLGMGGRHAVEVAVRKTLETFKKTRAR